MVQISRRKLNDGMLEKLFSLFFEMVGKRENRNNFQDVIDDIISPTEKIMIAKRIAIMYLVSKGVDHRSIANFLKVSTATVAKFALIARKSKGVIPTCNKMLKKEKVQDVLLGIFNEVYGPGVPGVNWSAAWERKKSLERHKRLGKLA